MPTDFDKIRNQLNAFSVMYEERATLISQGIEAFEAMLQAFDGKIEADVPIPESKHRLKFSRLPGGGSRWGLLLDDHPLVRCSVEIKAAAVTAFEPLLSEILNKHKSRGESLNKALETLSRLNIRKEG